jgi:hypothetical protein
MNFKLYLKPLNLEIITFQVSYNTFVCLQRIRRYRRSKLAIEHFATLASPTLFDTRKIHLLPLPVDHVVCAIMFALFIDISEIYALEQASYREA